MCGVFRGGRMPPRKIPPAPRTRCAAPGAKAGCVSLRQVSLHKQRKVARAVTARKLLILIPVAGQEKSKSSSLRSRPHPPSGHLLPLAGEGLCGRCPQAAERLRGPLPVPLAYSRNRSMPQRSPHPMAAWFTVVAPFLPDIIQMAKPMFTRDKGAEQVPQQIKELQRSEEHTSELQSLMRISYAVFCLKKKKQITK